MKRKCQRKIYHNLKNLSIKKGLTNLLILFLKHIFSSTARAPASPSNTHFLEMTLAQDDLPAGKTDK